MFACYYEDLQKYPLFNTPYKVHMRGFVELKNNNLVFLLYSHGKTIGLMVSPELEKVNFYEEFELKILLSNDVIKKAYDYEKEIIVDKNKPLFKSNVFSVMELGYHPVTQVTFMINSEIANLLPNISSEKFLEKMLGIVPIDIGIRTLDDYLEINKEIKKPENNLNTINNIDKRKEINNIGLNIETKINNIYKENFKKEKNINNIYKDNDYNWR